MKGFLLSAVLIAGVSLLSGGSDIHDKKEPVNSNANPGIETYGNKVGG